MLEAWLVRARGGSRADRGAGPRRQAALLEVVARNAAEAFHRHKLRRASDFGARSRALAELADQLGLEQAPLRIECYDISNLGPTDKVGSMVVFEDGLPKRSGLSQVQDQGRRRARTTSLRCDEMLRRRFTRLLEEQEDGPRRNGGGDSRIHPR